MWDDLKAEVNKKKHGVSFAEAATAFQDPNAIEQLDESHLEDEQRWILVGLSFRNRVLLVVFVEKHEETIRIISARKAHKDEVNQYYMRLSNQ